MSQYHLLSNRHLDLLAFPLVFVLIIPFYLIYKFLLNTWFSEETSKRKFLRGKLSRDGEKSFRRILTSKLVLPIIILILGALFILSLAIWNTQHPSSSGGSWPSLVDRWPKERSTPTVDERYVSSLDVNWDLIFEVIEKLTDKNDFQGIGLLNFNDSEIDQWNQLIPDIDHVVLRLDFVSNNVTWEALYPEWIDEAQVPTCPILPTIKVPGKPRIDLIAVKLPCRKSRDVARLHLQLSAARIAATSEGFHTVRVLVVTDCFPIPNLFTCKELVAHQGNVWLYEPNLHTLREKVQLPVGSCELALPLKTKEHWYSGNAKREAYATILHSGNDYICGAIAAAQSIRMAGSIRDLVILVDETISEYHRGGLEAAGWKIRTTQRIRNPKVEKDAYNEWNYSKFLLWQLTDYDKIIFIDADLLILRNINILFQMQEITATGNNATLFNLGVMVIEPSNCMFQRLMDNINEIVSYNGGDQGYLNEIFTWWHRIPKYMNFLKYFWEGDGAENK